jgi:hypothetical protein
MLHNSNYRDTRDPRTLRNLWTEVGNQVTGSDIESGYSYVYSWLANQFGHFMIGFAGTILVGWLFVGVVGLFSENATTDRSGQRSPSGKSPTVVHFERPAPSF